MRGLILRWGVNAIAIWVAFLVVSGITPVDNSVESVIVNALIFGLVNAFIRPLMQFMTCPLIILSLGMGALLVNTFMFLLAGWIGLHIGYGFRVDGFGAAFMGALVVSFVSVPISFLLRNVFKR